MFVGNFLISASFSIPALNLTTSPHQNLLLLGRQKGILTKYTVFINFLNCSRFCFTHFNILAGGTTLLFQPPHPLTLPDGRSGMTSEEIRSSLWEEGPRSPCEGEGNHLLNV